MHPHHGRTLNALLCASLAPTTVATYAKTWASFQRFCADNQLDPLPASTDTLLIWIATFAKRIPPLAPSTVRSHISCINTIHILNNLKPPSSSTAAFEYVMRGYAREYAAAALRGPQVRPQRLPLRAHHLAQVIHHVLTNQATVSLDTLRAAAAAACGFLFLLRASSLVAVHATDIAITPDIINIAIRVAKNHISPQPILLYFLPTADGLAQDVFRLFSLWMQRRPPLPLLFQLSPAEFFPVPSTAVSTWLRHALLAAGLNSLSDTGSFTSHSLRKGGATSAFLAGVPLATVRARGHWRADLTTLDHYIDQSQPRSEADAALWVRHVTQPRLLHQRALSARMQQ